MIYSERKQITEQDHPTWGELSVCTQRERRRTGKSGSCLELQKHISFILLFSLHLIFSTFPRIMYLYYWEKKCKENTRHLKELQLHLWLCSSCKDPRSREVFLITCLHSLPDQDLFPSSRLRSPPPTARWDSEVSLPCGPYSMRACSVVSDSVTPWTVTRQAPLSVGFSRQEYWKRLPFPTPGNLLNSGVKTLLLNWQVGSLALEPPRKALVVLDGIEHVQKWKEAFSHGRGKEKPLSGNQTRTLSFKADVHAMCIQH